jgi:hypothetical protein
MLEENCKYEQHGHLKLHLETIPTRTSKPTFCLIKIMVFLTSYTETNNFWGNLLSPSSCLYLDVCSTPSYTGTVATSSQFPPRWKPLLKILISLYFKLPYLAPKETWLIIIYSLSQPAPITPEVHRRSTTAPIAVVWEQRLILPC